MDKKELPLMVHLSELRSSIIQSAFGLFISMIICYNFSQLIFDFLKKPMLEVMPKNARFVILSPHEYFFVELKLALFLGFILATPWIFYQVWKFVAPGLYKNEKNFLIYFIFSASLCFIVGILFAYYLILPIVFEYFISGLPKDIEPSYSIGMLISFSLTILLSFAVVFQTPIIVFLLFVFGFVSLESLKKSRRYVFVICFIVGAILTPPDPLSQVMLAIPCYLLFELGLLVISLSSKKALVKKFEQ